MSKHLALVLIVVPVVSAMLELPVTPDTSEAPLQPARSLKRLIMPTNEVAIATR